jgi:hypothetical protein
MRDHTSLLLLCAAVAIARPAALSAQAVERSDTPRRGALRITFDPRIMTWEEEFTASGRQPLGAAFAGDSITQWRPAVALAEETVRATTGLAGYVARLGGSLLAVRAERRVMPIGFEYGITPRLSLGVTVPIVRVAVRERFRANPAGSNLGALDTAGYAAFFSNLGTALTQLNDSISAGAYGCPGSAECLRAQALLAQGQTLASALANAVHGNPDTAALFLPTAGSEAGRSITTIVSGLGRALADTFHIAAFSRDTFRLPAVPVPGDAADTLLDARLSALGLAPFANTARRLRFFTGDVEVTAKYRVLARDTYSAAAALVVRLPTGHQDSPNDPFDLATGDHQTDLEGRLTGELTLLHRLWLNLSVRAARQLPGQRERRIGPVDQPFLPATTLARLRWDPGDYVAVDAAPLFKFSRLFAAGITFGYYTQGRDRYAFLSPQDSIDVAGRVGGAVSTAVLEPGTGIRQARLGLAATFSGPRLEGGFSVERTISGAGGPVPVATVFRIVIRQTFLLF